jgi:hypothetical protein
MLAAGLISDVGVVTGEKALQRALGEFERGGLTVSDFRRCRGRSKQKRRTSYERNRACSLLLPLGICAALSTQGTYISFSSTIPVREGTGNS